VPTTVVNVRTAKPGTYIFCGRPTIYGNPFRLRVDGTREEVIVKYIDYFFDRMQQDAKFKEKIEGLRGNVLGCYCVPLLCHCSVIAEYLNQTERLTGSFS
jgi:hypothetical protein